jgi:hypothetical protein
MFKMAVTGMFGRHAHELHSAEASDDWKRQPEEWKSLADAQASAKRAVDRVLDVVRMHVYHFALFKLIHYNSIHLHVHEFDLFKLICYSLMVCLSLSLPHTHTHTNFRASKYAHSAIIRLVAEARTHTHAYTHTQTRAPTHAHAHFHADFRTSSVSCAWSRRWRRRKTRTC